MLGSYNEDLHLTLLTSIASFITVMTIGIFCCVRRRKRQDSSLDMDTLLEESHFPTLQEEFIEALRSQNLPLLRRIANDQESNIDYNQTFFDTASCSTVTPLIFAINHCSTTINTSSLSIITHLLAQNANPNISDSLGYAPLMHAISPKFEALSQYALINELLKFGASPTQVYPRGTPIEYAKIAHTNPEIIEQLQNHNTLPHF